MGWWWMMISVDWKILFICLWMICLMLVGWLDKQYCLIKNIWWYDIILFLSNQNSWWLDMLTENICDYDISWWFWTWMFFVRVDFIATAQRGSASASSDENWTFWGLTRTAKACQYHNGIFRGETSLCCG